MSVRYLICTLLCGAAVLFLASSDGMVNIAASNVIGSSAESREAAKQVAIGVVVGLMALGSVVTLLKSKTAVFGVHVVTFIAAVFSATLTIQATSIDYAANDDSGSMQRYNRKQNAASIEDLKEEQDTLKDKMDECRDDNYYGACAGTEARLAQITDEIKELREDNKASVMTQKIDIGDSVQEKAGIPALWLERATIYARAFCVPFMISVLMMGFWMFWGRFASTLPKKK